MKYLTKVCENWAEKSFERCIVTVERGYLRINILYFMVGVCVGILQVMTEHIKFHPFIDLFIIEPKNDGRDDEYERKVVEILWKYFSINLVRTL